MTVCKFLKILKIEQPYDTTILLMGIFLEKTIIQKDPCTPMFVSALFTIARTWKQPKCPSTEEWKEKMWYINTTEHYSEIKKEQKNTICSNMDEPESVQVELVLNSPPPNPEGIDLGLIPGLGRSPGGGHGNPLQYF